MSRASAASLVQDYLARDIPVGAMDLDSAWSTGFNNFVVDTHKFPDFKGFVQSMHSLGVNVICWATSMVDTDSSNYEDGKSKGYYVKGLTTDLIKWWHGKGSLLDYTNPAARAWWEKQLDHVRA